MAKWRLTAGFKSTNAGTVNVFSQIVCALLAGFTIDSRWVERDKSSKEAPRAAAREALRLESAG
jgi:hypothetical protein